MAVRREDIQALRAVSALLVAVFHIWFGGVSGGVDVFFVLTGYFLTARFLDCGAVDRSAIGAHYRRFLVLIVPQSFLVLTALLAVVFFLLSPTNLRDNLLGIAASALYVQNWQLIFSTASYGQTDWLLVTRHFWAMAIIGQVYLLWPLFLLLVVYAGRLAHWNRHAVLFWALCGLITASFIWSAIATAARPEQAYFDLFARLWEFGAGGLLAMMPRLRDRASPRAAALMSWLGLLLVLSCGFAIGLTASFPGYAALWPVAAAALLIIGGREHDPQNAGWLLARSGLAKLGSISFGIYLWHWPLFVVAFEAGQGETPSLPLGIALIAASIGLAYGTARLSGSITAMISGSGRAAAATTASLAGLCTVMLIAGGSFVLIRNSPAVRESFWFHSGILPGPFAARRDEGGYHLMQNGTSGEVRVIVRGHPQPSRSIALVGGSHTIQWLPALEPIALRNRWRISVITKESCVFGDPSDESIFKDENLHPSCAIWYPAVLKMLIAEQPDAVIALASRPLFGTVSRGRWAVEGERVPDAYRIAFEALADAGIPVIAIRDSPWMAFDIPTCVFWPLRKSPEECDRPRSALLDDATFQRGLGTLPPNVAVVDMTDAFCGPERCFAVRDGVLLYHDWHHLTATYARSLSTLLEERLAATLLSAVESSGFGPWIEVGSKPADKPTSSSGSSNRSPSESAERVNRARTSPPDPAG
jgi:peptidoglycan/LPS O-acetylase OafA/YrhL